MAPSVDAVWGPNPHLVRDSGDLLPPGEGLALAISPPAPRA